MIALPVATALQLEKGFKQTLIFSIVFSMIDIMSGLFLSYYLNVATGGFTALVSVFVLVMVMLWKRCIRKNQAESGGASTYMGSGVTTRIWRYDGYGYCRVGYEATG